MTNHKKNITDELIANVIYAIQESVAPDIETLVIDYFTVSKQNTYNVLVDADEEVADRVCELHEHLCYDKSGNEVDEKTYNKDCKYVIKEIKEYISLFGWFN